MPKQNFTTIEQLAKAEIENILEQATQFKNARSLPKILKNQTVALMFLEPSTRTRISFELAAKRLGATTILFDNNNSALQKGEGLEDTLATLNAMGCDFCVLRHRDDNIYQQLQQSSHFPTLINAGAGQYAHPTQALADLMTIKQVFSDWNNLSVAIVGDIAHSRVARSNLCALEKLGVRDIRLIGPEKLLPSNLSNPISSHHTSLQTGLKDVDVIMTLRLQKERMVHTIDENAYCKNYTITSQNLTLAKPEVILLHPGPVNRDIELSSNLIHHPSSYIHNQVSNGVWCRMALFQHLVTV